jgi:hypothetical protein
VRPGLLQSDVSAYASATIHKLFVISPMHDGEMPKRNAIRLQATEKAAASSYSLGKNRRRGLAWSINRSGAMMFDGFGGFPLRWISCRALELALESSGRTILKLLVKPVLYSGRIGERREEVREIACASRYPWFRGCR